jgi:hypothetical protein
LEPAGWRIVTQAYVKKFATTQYTLVNSIEEGGENSEVYLDVTCISSSIHFNRFKQRQDAFRRAFRDVRSRMGTQFGARGAVAFDAYVHLLKQFAHQVPGNALTAFQATCIGMFTIQIHHYQLKPGTSIAMSLFAGFLKFCIYFYHDHMVGPAGHMPNYRRCAIDVSNGGRWLTRVNTQWRSELYFMQAEVDMKTRPDERVNVAHSLVPEKVAAQAHRVWSHGFKNTAA